MVIGAWKASDGSTVFTHEIGANELILEDKSEVVDSVLGLIGNTPIVRINKLNPNPNVTIYAKLESQNPGGSIKDRIALSMIEDAEMKGELTQDKIILEATSGNTGIGLAMVAAVKGYRVVLTMSAGMSIERKKILSAFGAELVETDSRRGTDGAIEKAHEMLLENPKLYWMPNQYANPRNPYAHYSGTAVEIIRQVPEISHFVAGLGSTGTLMGVSKRLKEYNPKIKIIGVEPGLNHRVQGLKNMSEAIVPPIFDAARLDRKVTIADEPAYEMARRLVREEGLFAGISSGAAMWAAVEEAKGLEEGTIVVILPDRGERYTSTKLLD